MTITECPVDRKAATLTVQLDLDPDGAATVRAIADDSAEHAEALRRLRAWARRLVVEELIGEAAR